MISAAPDQQSALSAFVQDSLRRVSLGYLSWLVLALFSSCAIYYLSRESTSSAIGPALFLYHLLVAVHFVFRLWQGGRANILRPDIFFLLMYTMFHVAYVTLYALGIVPYLTEVFRFDDAIPAALFVVNLGLIGFLFGYEIMGLRAAHCASIIRPRVPTGSWCVIGLGVMMVALFMHITGLLLVGIDVFRSHGYKAVQDISEYAGYGTALVVSQSTSLMVLGLVIYLVGSALRYGKLFHSKLALGVILIVISILILEGDRGPMLMLGLPILLIRHYFIKRVRIRYLLLFFTGALVLFSGIRVVRETAFAPSEMWQEYQYQRTSGGLAWTDPFMEMGASFTVVNVTCHAVPNQEPYWRGASWAAAAVHVVPFLQGFAARNGWIRQEPSTWVTVTFWGPGRAGRAFTVSTEGYLNFGFPGAFLEVMFFGLFIRWLTVWFSRSPSATRAFVMFGCLGPSIMVIRNHVNLVTGICTYVIVIAILLHFFLGNERHDRAEPLPAVDPNDAL